MESQNNCAKMTAGGSGPERERPVTRSAEGERRKNAKGRGCPGGKAPGVHHRGCADTQRGEAAGALLGDRGQAADPGAGGSADIAKGPGETPGLNILKIFP